MQTFGHALEQGSPLSLNAFHDVEGICNAQASDDLAAQACRMFEDARHHNSNRDEIDAAVSLLKQSRDESPWQGPSSSLVHYPR